MSRSRSRFICQSCASATSKWAGRCESCGEWNTLVEEAGTEAVPKGLSSGSGKTLEVETLSAKSPELVRIHTGIAEFDLACGSGLAPGSALLVAGEPGIGKSTLLLQAAGNMANQGINCLYVTGEEAVEQIRHRATRLDLASAPVRLTAANNVRDILATVHKGGPAEVVIIDSIQTMFVDNLESAPGSVAQVRASAQALIAQAKKVGFCLVMLGHVTKEGTIAGPRVLEHMVDTVLNFEGDRSHQFRILRAVKNRFGATDEIGVFEMTGAGLAEVPNPSSLFLSDDDPSASGTSVFAGIEGTRPLLVEIQALVAPSPLGTPRRAVVGWDQARLSMVLAVLDARCGFAMAGRDVFLTITGGLRIGEPAADLAAAAALISSATGAVLPEKTVVFGEVGLSGGVRAVSQIDARLREAAKLGFTFAWVPPLRGASYSGSMKLTEVPRLSDLVTLIGGEIDASVAPDLAQGGG